MVEDNLKIVMGKKREDANGPAMDRILRSDTWQHCDSIKSQAVLF